MERLKSEERHTDYAFSCAPAIVRSITVAVDSLANDLLVWPVYALCKHVCDAELNDHF